MTVTYILWVVLECIIFSVMAASSGESSPPPPPPFILGKKEEMTEGRKVAG